MKYCRKCGSPVEDDALFCPQCGAPLAQKSGQPESAEGQNAAGQAEAGQSMAGQSMAGQSIAGQNAAGQNAGNGSGAAGGNSGYNGNGVPGSNNGYTGNGIPGGNTGYAGPGMPGGNTGYTGYGMPSGNNGYPEAGMPGASVPPKKPFKLTKKMIGGIAAAVAALVAVLVIVGIVKAQPVVIDLDDYADVTFDGYDGYGTASVSFDYNKYYDDLANALYKKGVISSKSTDNMYNLLSTSAKLASIEEPDCKLDKDSDLSNGDTVKLTYDYDNSALKKVKLKFKGKGKKVKVSGLKTIKSFDPFDDLKVSFDGTAPNGEVDYEYDGDYSDDLEFSADKEDGLSNGDKVTITCKPAWSDSDDFTKFANEHGAMPSETKKTYTVSGLKAYVTKIAQIPKDMLTKMDAQAQDEMKSDAANWNDPSSYHGMTLLGYYLLVSKGKTYGPTDRLYLVYQVSATDDKGNNFTYYKDYYYDDITILSDNVTSDTSSDTASDETSGGTCSVDLDEIGETNDIFYIDGYYYYGYQTLDSLFNNCVTKRVDDYTYESTVDGGTSTSDSTTASTAA